MMRSNPNGFGDFASIVGDLFVPVDSAHITAGGLVYLSPDATENMAAMSFLNAVDLPSYLKTARLNADRYGGLGIFSNGGSGRSVFDGTYSIKGIGPSSLVGKRTEETHSDGKLSLRDALSEAFWTELINRSFPVGATKCFAIFAIDGEHALLFREPVIRLAHFERAIYFTPKSDFRSHRLADVRRTATACQNIYRFLPARSYGGSHAADGSKNALSIMEGLSALSRKHAAQLAHSRSVFVLHSYSSSNVAISGEWMDSTLVDVNPSGARVTQEFKFAWRRFWTAEMLFFQTLSDVIFYLTKYDSRRGLPRDLLYSLCIDSFRDEYRKEFAKGFLLMFGVPEVIAARVYTAPSIIRWALRVGGLVKELVDSSPIGARLDDRAVAAFSFVHFQSNAAGSADIRFQDKGTTALYVEAAALILRCANGLLINSLELRRCIYAGTFARTQPTSCLSFDSLNLHFTHLSETVRGRADATRFMRESFEELYERSFPKLRQSFSGDCEVVLGHSNGDLVIYNWRTNRVRFRKRSTQTFSSASSELHDHLVSSERGRAISQILLIIDSLSDNVSPGSFV